MPRKSLRRKALDYMQSKVLNLRLEHYLREVDDDEDSSLDDNYMKESATFEQMKKTRYLYRSPTYRKDRKEFDLEDVMSHDSATYNDEEFLNLFRIKRDSFHLLLDEMKTKKAFVVKRKSAHQRPVAFQLLVFLYRVGMEGTSGGSSLIASFFGIGKGSVNNYVRRTVSALHEIIDDVVYWPNKKERKELRKRFAAYGFRHCVGIIDGTLIILDHRPEAYHECYYSRKCFYALNVMIVCDDNKRITYYNAGWPGSTHDNRVFRNTDLYLNRGDYFSRREYLLGDSAYSASPVMVQAFKKQTSEAELSGHRAFFNTVLAQVRISSEHCIGMLKGRFRCLKRNNIKLKKETKEVKELVDLIGACVVLHNLLINYEENNIPSSWYDEVVDDIDWTLYDEEEEDIAEVTDDNTERRKYVYNSIINNYLI